MSNFNIVFVDKIVEACFKLYKETPKSGKPTAAEWTVLSCVVKYDTDSEVIEVVSLGTGSKCIGATKMSPRGDLLNDSHAEIFARRGFLLYLYENIDKALEKQPSIFNYSCGRFLLKQGVKFAFYSSQLPCGDASIIPKLKAENDKLIGDIIQSKKHKLETSSETEPKKVKLEDDIHRTGAKCLPSSEQDSKESGTNYHILGQVRTKPGRGDRTLSVSCSDKIARWIHMGIQGSLLSLLCEPIFINHFIFGSGVPYSEESIHRALLNRSPDSSILKPEIIPDFYQSSLQFQSIRTESAIRPAAGSIVWVKLNDPLSEVAVHGKKLGATKKKASSIKPLCISKYNIYKRFTDILDKNKEIKQIILQDALVESVPYNEMKKKATDYGKKWCKVKDAFFKTWTVKPDIWDFCMESCQ